MALVCIPILTKFDLFQAIVQRYQLGAVYKMIVQSKMATRRQYALCCDELGSRYTSNRGGEFNESGNITPRTRDLRRVYPLLR